MPEDRGVMPEDRDDAPTPDEDGDGRSLRNRRAAHHAHRVRGEVRTPDGAPVAGAAVEVLRRRLRGDDVSLATTRTDRDGRYAVNYPPVRADLVVRASAGPETAISPVVIGAGPDETIDLVLGGAYLGPSDLTRLEREVAPILERESPSAGVAELDEEEIALLAAKSGADPGELVLLRQSAALAVRTGLSTALFYALGRQRVPLSMAAIASTDPARRRDAVTAAIAGNQVPPALASLLDRELAALESIVIAEALRVPAPAGGSTLGSLLTAAGVPARTQAELVALHGRLEGDTTAFWREVRGSGLLAPPAIDRLQDALRLGAIVLGHVPLVEALQARRLHTPKDLAALEMSDWLDLVASAGMPPDLAAAGITTDEYAARIATLVEESVSTARLAVRADHLPGSPALRRFLERNPAFEIRATSVAAYLREHSDALDFLPDEEARRTFRRQLEGIERIYRIAPVGARLAVMERLLADGVDSAQKVRAMGRTGFLRRYGEVLGADLARRLYARASQAVATATTLIARHGSRFDGTSMHVLPPPIDALVRFPGYRDLFGSLDTCACEHCQSLYSPSAYLVDVLHWLDGRTTAEGGSALDLILDEARRADLGTIELSCASSHTPLPAIDLVNELLELSVAPPETPPAYQTRGAAADLRVQPEHQHGRAYAVVADAVYPFDLPYSLALDEARTYLAPLAVPRHVLMERLHTGGARRRSPIRRSPPSRSACRRSSGTSSPARRWSHRACRRRSGGSRRIRTG